MSTVKTVTGYSLALLVILALVVGACGIDTTPQPATNATQPQPPVEDVTVTDSELPEGDGIDEYNTVQLMHIYEASLEAIPAVLPLSMGPSECETYGSIVGNAQFWIGFFDQDTGFWSTAPDELQYLLTEKQVKQDVAPMIDAYCDSI